MMARRGGKKGDLKKRLEGNPTAGKKLKGAAALNDGRGQEITGVSLPTPGE